MTALKIHAELIHENRVILTPLGHALLQKMSIGATMDEAARQLNLSLVDAKRILDDSSSAIGNNVFDSPEGGITTEGMALIEEYSQRMGQLELALQNQKYRRPATAADGIIMMGDKLVLIKRGNDPFKGMYALPGGFIEYGEECEQAVLREVQEETGLFGRIRRLVGVYSSPSRDPRGHAISVVYELEAIGGELVAGDDADAVGLFGLDELPKLAFDHEQIIEDFKAFM